MKRCVPAASGRVCAVLVIAACGAGSAFFLRMLFSEEGFQPPLLFMGIALAGVAAHLLWSMVSKGNWGFFYNEERIVFVLSRKDRREYCWKELPEAGVTFLYPTAFCPNGTFFFSNDRVQGVPRHDSEEGGSRPRGHPPWDQGAQRRGGLSYRLWWGIWREGQGTEVRSRTNSRCTQPVICVLQPNLSLHRLLKCDMIRMKRGKMEKGGCQYANR